MKRILTILVTIIVLMSSMITASAKESKYQTREDFLWGVNIHNQMSPVYRQDPELYIKTSAELGVNLVRINIPYLETVADFVFLDKVVSLCEEYGLKLMVVFSLSENLEYNTNFYEMACKRYDGKSGNGFIDYIAIGGEEEAIYMTQSADGDSMAHYDEDGIKKLHKEYASAIEGVKKSGTTAKTVITFSHLHYAPLLYMYENGLDFDIIGIDWYTNMGEMSKVLDPVLKNFPHDIIFCETNLWNNSSTDHDDASEWDGLIEYMEQAYATERVKGLYFYELMDQINLHGNPDYGYAESHFGFCYAYEDGQIRGFKPIYERIQKLLGGGPVSKKENIKEPDISSPSKDSISDSSTNQIKPSAPNISNGTDSNIQSSVENTDSVVQNIEIQEIVTTTTTHRFPGLFFIIGTIIILTLGALVFVVFYIQPKFLKKIFKK